MLDVIVSQTKIEIAIEGPAGVTRDGLWQLVQQTATKTVHDLNLPTQVTPNVDDAYKQLIWPFIVNEPQLNFFHDTSIDAMQVDHNNDAPSAPDTLTTEANIPEQAVPASHNESTPSSPVGETSVQPKKTKGKAPAKRKAKKKPAKKKKPARRGDHDDSTGDEYQPDEDDDESSEDDEDFDMEAEEADDDNNTPRQKEDGNAESSKTGLSIVVDTSGYQRIDDIKDLSFEQVENMYGSRLRVVADAELQKEQLFVGLPPGKPIPENQAIVLGVILRSRHKGYTQAALTKDLGLDARSSGHYVKTLANRGAIIRKPVSAGFRTNLCIHVRFNTTDEQKHKAASTKKPIAYNINAFGVAYTNKTLTVAVAKLLDGAPDNVMYTDDILKALAFNPGEKYVRKWFFRSMDEPCSKNIFRKLRPPKQGTSRIIQLIDHRYANKAKGSSMDDPATQTIPNVDAERREKGCVGLVLKSRGDNSDRITGLDYDMMFEPQLLDALYSMGTKGATQKELGHILGYSDQRALYKGLEKLCSLPKTPDSTRFTVQKSLEFEGRIKRYRYYTLQAYMQQTENKSIELTGPPKYTVKQSDLAYIDYRCAENRILSPEAAKNIRNTQPSPEPTPEQATASKKRGRPRQSSHANETTSSETEAPASKRRERQNTSSSTAESDQSSQSNLASIFLPRKRALAQTTTTTTEDGSRDEDEEQQTNTMTQENNEPPRPKRPRGRPRKNPAPTASTAEQSTDTPQPKRPRGRPRKNQVPAESTSVQEPINDPEPQQQQHQQPESTMNVDEPTESTTSQGQNATSTEPTREESTPISDMQEQHQVPESPMDLDQRVPSSSRQSTTPSRQSTTPSRQDITPSRQNITPRRNLFDYFSPMSRTTSPQSKAPKAIGELTTNPGESFRQRMAEIQSEANKQPAAAAESSSTEPATTQGEDNNTTTCPSPLPAITVESPQTPSRSSSRIDDPSKKRITTRHSDKLVRTKDGITSAKHTRTSDSANSYLITRKNVMLELLNEKGILERGGELKVIFLEKYREKYGDSKMARNPDNKTVWRSVESLAQEGHCYITTMNITTLTGKPQNRTLAVRQDLSKDGPEMAAFIEEQEHKRVQIAYRGKMAKFETFDKDVERLEDRLVRMEDTRDTLRYEESPEARRLRDDIKTLKENMTKASQLSMDMHVAKSARNWFMIAIQYGFIGSKWVRVKLIHQYLFALLQSGGDGINQEKRTIRPTAIIMRMKLGLFLQTIGYYSTSNELSEYIQDQSNLEKTLAELPENIKIMLISEKNRFRRRLRALIDHLILLKAVDQIDDKGNRIENFKDTMGNFPPAYRICDKIPIIDYWTPDRPVIREFIAQMPSDILVYWSDLQYFSTSTSNDQRGSPHPESEDELLVIRALVTPRNWSSHYVFAREQREVLNSFVDKKAGQTPYSNTPKCKEIARSLKVPLQMVLNYYRGMEAAFTRKLDKKAIRDLEEDISGRRKRRRRRGGTEAGSTANRAITVNTKKVFRKHITYSTARQLLQEQEQAEAASNMDHRDGYLNDETSIPLVDANINIYDLNRRRVRRIQWTVEEDELLLYCYVIMKTRARRLESRFQWKSIQTVLPGRTTERCRHRVSKLKAIPKVADHIVHLTGLWDMYYKQGINSGALTDDNPLDAVNFNLLEYLEYFIRRIQTSSTGELILTAELPPSRQQLESEYDIYVPVGEESCLKRFEDVFHTIEALVQKEETLASNWLTIRTPWDHVYDTLPDKAISEEEKDLELVMLFNRMILFTPDEMYDPFFAYSVISQYPEDLRKRAQETMRNHSQLSIAKGARCGDRRLPGTQLGISERYITRMACNLPDNIYQQAKVFERYLMTQHTAKYAPQLVSSGMMACIINLISCNKLKLELLLEDIFNMKAKIPFYRSRLIDEKLSNLSVQLRMTAPPDDDGQQEPQPISKDDHQLRKLGDLELRDHWACVLQSQEPDVQGELKTMMAVLESAEDQGVTLHQIKDGLVRSGSLASDKEIHEYMDIMCNASPPLVAKVGFESHRYVLTSYLDHWVIIPTRIPNVVAANSDEVVERTTKLAGTRKAIIHPRVWYDINGRLTGAVLQGIIESIIQCVLQRPGIIERDICRRFHKLLVYVEVKDVLDMLINCGVLRKQTIVHTMPKANLFSKRRVYTSSSDPCSIDRSSQTCYWTTSNYYKNCFITLKE